MPIKEMIELKGQTRIFVDRTSFHIFIVPILFIFSTYHSYTGGEVVVFATILFFDLLILIIVGLNFPRRIKRKYSHASSKCKICGNSSLMNLTEGHCSGRCFTVSNRWFLLLIYGVSLLISLGIMSELLKNDFSLIYFIILDIFVFLLVIPPLIAFYVDTVSLRSKYYNKNYIESEIRRKTLLYPPITFEKSQDTEQVVQIKNYINLSYSVKSAIKLSIAEITLGIMIGSRGLFKQRRSLFLETINFVRMRGVSRIPELLIDVVIFFGLVILLNTLVVLLYTYIVCRPKIRFCEGSGQWVDLLVTQLSDKYNKESNNEILLWFPLKSCEGLIRRFTGFYEIEMPHEIPKNNLVKLPGFFFSDSRFSPFEPRDVYIKLKSINFFISLTIIILFVLLYFICFILIINHVFGF